MELSKVTMILRGYTYEQVRCVAEVLINSSYVKNMEITLNTSNAYEIIKKIADEGTGSQQGLPAQRACQADDDP